MKKVDFYHLFLANSLKIRFLFSILEKEKKDNKKKKKKRDSEYQEEGEDEGSYEKKHKGKKSRKTKNDKKDKSKLESLYWFIIHLIIYARMFAFNNSTIS